MRVGSIIKRKGKNYIELFPYTPRDVYMLGEVPKESKTYHSIKGTGSTEQTAILVEVKAWANVGIGGNNGRKN